MDQTPLKRPQFFFTTAPLPCPYLPERLERKIVTELSGPGAERAHEGLARAGFRRSHSIAYAPSCPGCRACVAVRVRVAAFNRKRTFARTWRDNADLLAVKVPAKATAEQYDLFARYQQSRHTGSDMALMGFYEYSAMVEDSPIDTYIVEFRDKMGALAAVCLTDRTSDGLSAVYSFFEAGGARRGLGNYVVLWLIEHARRLGLPYVYLGYWIADSAKMSYKIRFQPLEALGPGGWEPLVLSARQAAAAEAAEAEAARVDAAADAAAE
ncbi:MAG: arginyltransferase [Rhodospirillaceae bacterium]|nr:arginyltransferase [Rhodospirillaceae bacterium]